MKQIQKGFGSDLGYTPVPAMASDDAFYINLLPMSGPRTPQGFVLERDDACTFYLPFANVLQTAFAEYLKAPSENCQINVTYFDDSADNVIQGLMVQSALEAAMASFGGHNYEPQVTIEMGVQVTSATPPDLSLAGTTNPNPI